MHRPGRAVAFAAGVALLAGCDDGTVRLDGAPEIGARSVHRYELEATITRFLQGEEPAVSEVDVTVDTEAEVLELTDDGVRAEVTIRRRGEGPRTAQVVLGRGGTLQDLELVEGLPAAATGLDGFAALFAAAELPPDEPLRPGDRWVVREDAVQGSGRLERLAVVDGEPVAVVRSDVLELLDGTDASGLEGELRTSATTTYDLGDGSVRRSTSTSSGSVDALIQPPEGVDAEPVQATISYDVQVRVVRLR